VAGCEEGRGFYAPALCTRLVLTERRAGVDVMSGGDKRYRRGDSRSARQRLVAGLHSTSAPGRDSGSSSNAGVESPSTP
jgi:hypothetical protein